MDSRGSLAVAVFSAAVLVSFIIAFKIAVRAELHVNAVALGGFDNIVQFTRPALVDLCPLGETGADVNTPVYRVEIVGICVLVKVPLDRQAIAVILHPDARQVYPVRAKGIEGLFVIQRTISAAFPPLPSAGDRHKLTARRQRP